MLQGYLWKNSIQVLNILGNRIVQLERTYKEHQVQLLDHCRVNQKLKRIIKGIIQMPAFVACCAK